ncbi:metalloprotease family M38 [Pelomyxa schiedti]|nr:metalloprotease family M38 [Pelomyxa schiedti]
MSASTPAEHAESGTSSQQAPYLLRVSHAAQIVTVCAHGERLLRGADMDRPATVAGPASVVVGRDGAVAFVGGDAEVDAAVALALAQASGASSTPTGPLYEEEVDATGMSIVPGLVDAHTHPVWSGDRVHEYILKLAGATYMEIHQAGGGIGFTVGHTKKSSEEELRNLLLERMDRMLAQGTTLMEGKSGYGLDTETEMKLLKVLHSVKGRHPIEVVSTFLGAHSVPKTTTPALQTDYIINDMIPTLVHLRDQGEISPEFVDVFLEQGVFDYDDTERILLAGKKVGMDINFHGDEIHFMRAGELGGKLGALAISHLEKVSLEGMQAMAIRPTFAVLLPTTAFILRITPPPAKKLIENNVPVVLASDYNPNAHCMSLPMTMNLACVLMGMTMNQALVATTINAAASINRAATHGSLERGKVGDLVIIKAPRWEHLVYEMGDPPIYRVYKKGKLAWAKS